MEKFTFYFEPDNPITNPREFTDELIKYCKKNNIDYIFSLGDILIVFPLAFFIITY
ncbi:hypothetical protein [Candidatus Clostridium stratigraminis]|uniref:Uncharacterized protein n=1 Tax=Candidatus Clostridium stratigraminis TaxID=3381661 RepID=A0ABW8T3H4_9CLOT